MQKLSKKTKLSLFVVIQLAIIAVSMVPQQAMAAAGTAGSFSGDTADQVFEGSWLTLYFTGLTSNAEYIIVPSSASLANRTFSTGTSETTKEIQIKVDASGSMTFTVYGYSTTTGAASGTALDVWLLYSTPKSDQNADQVTNLFPFFIGLLIASLLIGLVFKKKYM